MKSEFWSEKLVYKESLISVIFLLWDVTEEKENFKEKQKKNILKQKQ